MTFANIDNAQDIIDTRDLIERIEELEAEIEAETDARQERESDTPAEEREPSDAEIELSRLKAFARQIEDYCDDYEHGETLIRDTYFRSYAQDLAEDCGMIPADAKWPCNCIDWQQAARELQQDYTSADFDGVTYWFR